MPKASDHNETPAMHAIRRSQLNHAGARSGVIRRWAPPTALAVTALPLGTALASAASASIGSPGVATNDFTQTNLIANKASLDAKLVDPNLTNACASASGATSAIWV
jgi:hypothetical protein